jgi:hypothetical protein
MSVPSLKGIFLNRISDHIISADGLKTNNETFLLDFFEAITITIINNVFKIKNVGKQKSSNNEER